MYKILLYIVTSADSCSSEATSVWRYAHTDHKLSCKAGSQQSFVKSLNFMKNLLQGDIYIYKCMLTWLTTAMTEEDYGMAKNTEVTCSNLGIGDSNLAECHRRNSNYSGGGIPPRRQTVDCRWTAKPAADQLVRHAFQVYPASCTRFLLT
jgi:hypothetical protein